VNGETAVFPTLADLAAQGDKTAFAEALVASLRGLLLLLVPACGRALCVA